MMFRNKILFFIFFGFPIASFSQAEFDTTYLIKNACTLDNIYPTFLPAQITSVSGFDFDSSYFIRSDAKKKLIVESTHLTYFVNGDSSARKITDNLKWNSQGRIESLSGYSSNKEIAQYNFIYSNGKTLKRIIIPRFGTLPDTLLLEWDRSGRISSEHYVSSNTQDSIISKLYNSKGKLIVMPLCPYGHLLNGRMIFDYDEDGKLISRKFQTIDGARTICDDSIVYSYEDSAKTIRWTKHYLQIPVYHKTILIDEIKEDLLHNRIMEYWLDSGPPENKKYEIENGHFSQWNYNVSGKLAWLIIGDQHGDYVVYRKYYYNEKSLCDSIYEVHTAYNGKLAYDVLQKTEILEYDPATSLLQIISEVTFTLSEKNKKAKWFKSDVSVIMFDWK